MVRVLTLFSGTHSIGKICKERGWEEVSLDRDIGSVCPLGSGYESSHHIKEDIMTWDYTSLPSGYFDIITASPVCLWWSSLRRCWLGRKLKHLGRPFTKKDLQDDIDKYGKPMVDKVREIIDYFQPKFYWIENPQTGTMKTYITDLPFYDVDYCKYADWGYKKRTRFWTNISNFEPKLCKRDCKSIKISGKTAQHKNLASNNHYVVVNGKRKIINTKKDRIKYKHKKDVSRSIGGGSNRIERYRIPPQLIRDLFDATQLPAFVSRRNTPNQRVLELNIEGNVVDVGEI